MPIIFQHPAQTSPRLAVWKITEPLDFFEFTVPVASHIPHPQVRLRHVAARYLLNELMPGFPYDQLQIADSGKPHLPGTGVHFSLTHCGDFAAAIVSQEGSVGIDLEASGDRIFRIRHKFLSDVEQSILQSSAALHCLQEGEGAAQWLTRAWSAKESIYKWHGELGVDFIRDISLLDIDLASQKMIVHFAPSDTQLTLNYHSLEGLELTWIGESEK
jgi:phosphopantetheinyl transferase